MNKLIKGYETRMKDYVLKMAQKPIIIKKQKDKYSTSRQELLAMSANKILDKKGFQFKPYRSDIERIKEFLIRKESIDKYLDEIASIKKKKEILNKKKNEPKLIQPSMRFTARTDLERVYDIIKNREIVYDEEKVIKRQLAKMGFASHVVDEDEDSEEEETENNLEKMNHHQNIIDENLTDEERYKKELHNKIIQQRKNMINKRKFLLDVEQIKKIDNSKAKHLRGELYQKTHFKTMENISMFKTSTINHNIFKKWKKEDEKKQQNIKIKNIYDYNSMYNETVSSYFPKLNDNPRNKMGLRKKISELRKIGNYEDRSFKRYLKNNDYFSYYNNIRSLMANKQEDMSYRKNKSTNQKKKFNLITSKKILEELELTNEIANSNPLLFNLNFNNIKSDFNHSHNNQEQLDVLKKMAFEKNNEKSDEYSVSNDGNWKNDYDDLKKEENIVIDGKEYKKSETYKIADKLLKKCNYNENKVKYNSNEGGLMFTNGLTIKEFEAKYGL